MNQIIYYSRKHGFNPIEIKDMRLFCKKIKEYDFILYDTLNTNLKDSFFKKMFKKFDLKKEDYEDNILCGYILHNINYLILFTKNDITEEYFLQIMDMYPKCIKCDDYICDLQMNINEVTICDNCFYDIFFNES
tara:strand:+ start:8877 stop:9278 length:402 start_codon:yes stop_codon:yes gene_type:complete